MFHHFGSFQNRMLYASVRQERSLLPDVLSVGCLKPHPKPQIRKSITFAATSSLESQSIKVIATTSSLDISCLPRACLPKLRQELRHNAGYIRIGPNTCISRSGHSTTSPHARHGYLTHTTLELLLTHLHRIHTIDSGSGHGPSAFAQSKELRRYKDGLGQISF